MTAFRHTQRGLSIVELLIGSALNLLLVAAMISLYLNAKQTYSLQDSLARMQENARLALRLISHDVRMSGYNGGIAQRWSIAESTNKPIGTVSNECYAGWAHAPVLPSDGVITPTLTGANNDIGVFSGCIASTEHVTGTDILSVHFAAMNSTADNAIEKGKTYLRGTFLGGLIYKATANNSLPADFAYAGTAHNYRLIAAAYYLRPWSTTAPTRANPTGDGIPTLMRATLSDCGAIACVKSEALVEGIANLQLQYSVANGAGAYEYLNADQLRDFTQTTGKAQWCHVKALRIGLLARTLEKQGDYIDQNAPYRLGDQTINVSAGYRHLWVTSTQALRNLGS